MHFHDILPAYCLKNYKPLSYDMTKVTIIQQAEGKIFSINDFKNFNEL